MDWRVGGWMDGGRREAGLEAILRIAYSNLKCRIPSENLQGGAMLALGLKLQYLTCKNFLNMNYLAADKIIP